MSLRTIFSSLTFALLFIASNSDAQDMKTISAQQLAIGAKAVKMSHKMTEVSGTAKTLKSLKKKNGLLVLFSCNTCPYVLMWEDRYPELEKFCNKNDIGIVLVNSNKLKRSGSESFDKMKEHAKKKEHTIPYLYDKDQVIANAFGATKTPHVFLFNNNLKLAYKGAIDDNAMSPKAVKKPYLKNALKSMVANQPIEVNSTKSLGCRLGRPKNK
ncbi:MAG: redoxin family protein [Aureispira sp.]|nr:redoxin family protein [Aureispira sp.]